MIVESAPGEGTRVTLVVPDTGESEEAKKNAVMKEAHKKRVKVRHKSELCRVLIVDDHKIMREGLVQMLSSEPGLEVVGQAADGREALAKADELSPDVIIMDVNLGEMSGVEVTKQILHQHPEIRVIGLSMHRDRDVAEAMLEAGACDYRTKSDPSEELIKVVRSCAPSSKFNSGR